MQIIFKKKNNTTTDRTYPVDEGSTITENYNETLDSAVIRLSHLTEPLDIEPFDKVVLHDEVTYKPNILLPAVSRLADKYMCIDTYTETMESLDPVLYSYEIHLFSETKELEGIILPNLSITQLPDGTSRSVWYYLHQFLDVLYCPYRYTEAVGGVNGVENKYYFAGSVQTKFSSIDCPEMQWNNPTLREVLNDLMMVGDCIVVMRNNVIEYIDLTKKRNAIDTSKVNYIQKSQSSEDYVSELKMEMLNVMQTSLPNIKSTVDRVEYLTFKADDGGYVVTEENMCLFTQYPILKIKHLYMTFQALDETTNYFTMYKCDLRNIAFKNGNYENFVYEYTQYSALPIRKWNQASLSEVTQNVCVYYKMGSNIISGFNTLSKKIWTLSGKETTLTRLKNAIPDVAINLLTDRISSNHMEGKCREENSWFSTFFTIEYETTADAVFGAGKSDAPTHNRTVIDNQTNSYVDAYNQGFMEYQKANRLGNHQLFINARYTDSWGNLIKIGDYYNDSIIFQTQYQIYKEHIEVNATATKDYILRDYFTGVKARIRSWKIADESQSFTRHELQKYYLEFSKKQKSVNTEITDTIAYYFLSPLYSDYLRPLKYCFINGEDNAGYNYPSWDKYYSVELLGRIVGNSVVFTFGFDDNFLACGKRISSSFDANADIVPSSRAPAAIFDLMEIDSDYLDDYGGVPLEDTRYVDNNGEMKKVKYWFTYDYTRPTLPSDREADEPTTTSSTQEKTFFGTVLQYPITTDVFTSYKKFYKEKYFYKDNREIIKLSTQFELCSDTHDIVFTKKFLEYQECLNLGFDRWTTFLVSRSHFSSTGFLNVYHASITSNVPPEDMITKIETTVTADPDSVVQFSYATVSSGTLTVTVMLVPGTDILDHSFNVSIKVYYISADKPLRILRDDNTNYDFRNTVPGENARNVGDNSNISVASVTNNTAVFSIYNLSLHPDELVVNSVFYIGAMEDGVFHTWIMLNGIDTAYLNVLLSREYAVYDANGDVIDEI